MLILRPTQLAFSCVLLSVLIFVSHSSMLNALSRCGNREPIAVTPSAVALKKVSLGYERLLADLFWLSFVQYFGDSEARIKDHYSLSENYMQSIFALDPQYIQAYYFAAFVIGGEENHPANSAKILSQGIVENPGEWRLPYIAGINQYLFAHDVLKTASYYEMSSKCFGAPIWIGRQARILKTRLPELVKQFYVWNSVYESSEDKAVRSKAKAELVRVCRVIYRLPDSVDIKLKILSKLRSLDTSLE